MRILISTITLTACLAFVQTGTAQELGTDSMTVAYSVGPDTVEKKKGLINRIIRYFSDSNKEKRDGKFDFSLIGGPHYSTDTKLGLGLVASGLYRTDRRDSLLPYSNVDLYGDITTANYYMLGIRGTNIFPQDRYRMEYNVKFESFLSDFWGIGFKEGDKDSNESEMKRMQFSAKASFLWKVADNMYAGPTAAFDYVHAGDVERPELLDGMARHTWNVGYGAAFVYDSRDVLTNPHKGMYVNVTQMFRPAFLGNEYAFSTTDLRFDIYRKLWKGAILAYDFRSTLNFGKPSWGMMARLGSSSSMRGYYEGRYRDKHKFETQIELRQHVWRRNGIVVWVGTGTVFGTFGELHADRLLPNYGLGYRWEFKKDVNVRIDYGFGKSGQRGFNFNISEAF